MATKAEIQAQIEELQAQMEAASEFDDDEVWVERDGTKFQLKGPKAKAFLAKHRDMWEEAKEEAEEELEEAEEVKPKPAAKKAAKPPVKRTPAKPKVEKVEEEEIVEEELESEEHVAPRTFFGR